MITQIPSNVDFSLFATERHRAELGNLIQATNTYFATVRNVIKDDYAVWNLYKELAATITLAVVGVSGGLKAAS